MPRSEFTAVLRTRKPRKGVLEIINNDYIYKKESKQPDSKHVYAAVDRTAILCCCALLCTRVTYGRNDVLRLLMRASSVTHSPAVTIPYDTLYM